MRIWSIHPKYLDNVGLVSCWRETLLAKHVLLGKTKGYTKHPQLERFHNTTDPINSINTYLNTLYNESMLRGMEFNKTKIGKFKQNEKINVTNGQIKYEFEHLQRKLKSRNVKKYQQNKLIAKIECNSMFNEVKGGIEKWEKNVFENRIMLYEEFINKESPVLFLDIDNVLCMHDGKWSQKEDFDVENVKALNEITSKTNCEIVISSNWRYNYTLDEIKRIFKKNGIKKMPFDTTEKKSKMALIILSKVRTQEILNYIKRHSIVNYCVVDDYDIYLDNFVKINKNIGLKENGVKENVISILKS